MKSGRRKEGGTNHFIPDGPFPLDSIRNLTTLLKAWSNTTQLQSKFNQLKKHVANMIKNSDRRLDMNAENDEVLNSKIKTLGESIQRTHSEINDLGWFKH